MCKDGHPTTKLLTDIAHVGIMSRITTQSYKEQQHNSLLEKNVMKIQMLTNFLYIFINCPCEAR